MHRLIRPINKKTKKLRSGAEKDKNKKHGERLFICPAVPVIWQHRVAGGGGRRGGGGDVNWGKKKKAPERLSLLVLAAVAPAAHGGCGAERPIHPAHQGRTQHRKTGRKRGYSSWAHCLSV